LSGDDERHIGFLISDVARLMRTAFDRRVRKLGLTRSQWLVINRLYRRPGATQSELAEMLEIEKPTASRMVDRMQAKGWVERRADGADRLHIALIPHVPDDQRQHLVPRHGGPAGSEHGSF